MKIKTFFIHRDSGDFLENRFDTLLMPNGSIAALLTIAKSLGIQAVAIDESYFGSKSLQELLFAEIEKSLSEDITPVILCTLLSYNAKKSIFLLENIKKKYSSKVRTGVGGQLVRVAPEAYLDNSSIDHISVGDAEITLEQLIIENKRLAKGFVYESNVSQNSCKKWQHYASLSYDNYVGFRERLEEMSKCYIGPFTNIRQAVVESVRGCIWGYTLSKPCEFCALQDVTSKPVFDIEQQSKQEKELVEKWKCNWIFDVSNQWLPTFRHKEQWLEDYIGKQQAFSVPPLNKYVYLTTNSINKDTAPLLRKAGVKIVYVGIDGWNSETWKAHGKTREIHTCLEACKANNLYLRTAAVIGEGATSGNLKELRQFVRHVADSYGDILIQYGAFLEIILPGSPVWYRFKDQAYKDNIKEAMRIYQKMYSVGYLDRTDERNLTRLFMEHSPTCDISYDEALEAEQWIVDYINQHTSGVGTTLEKGGNKAR